MVGQRSAAARAVRGDPVVLDEQPLVEDLLQRPPDALHVRGVHRAVRVVGVDPVAHPVGHLLEEIDVAEHCLAAFGIELGDAERLDIGFAVEAELLLDGDLDGEPVAVPAALALDQVAAHGLEPREYILEDACLDMVGARRAVGGRRTFVEGPARCSGALAQGALERRVVAPLLQHLELDGGKVDVGRDGRVSGVVPIVGVATHVVLRRARMVRGFRRRDESRRRRGPRYHPSWSAYADPLAVIAAGSTERMLPAVLPAAPR